MDKLAALVALVALGGVAWLALDPQAEPGADVSAQLDQQRADISSLSDRLDMLLARMDERHLVSGSRGAASTGSSGPGLAPGADGVDAAESEPSIGERLARIEERLAEQEERAAKTADAPFVSRGRPMRLAPFGNKRFLRSVDDAAKALELSDAQRSDMESILENARHELDRLYDTQDENGDSLAALQKSMHDKIKNGKDGNAPLSIMEDVMKMSKFKRKQIPGSNETFAQAEQRIHKNAMNEIRRGLSPAQQKEWDGSHTAALLPGAGGATTVSTVMVGEPGGVFLGGEIEVEDGK